MAAEHDHIAAPSREDRDDVGHRDRAVGGPGLEGREADLEAGARELPDDVLPSSRERGGARRPRPELHEPHHVAPGGTGVEGGRRRRVPRRWRDGDDRHQRRQGEAGAERAPHGRTPVAP